MRQNSKHDLSSKTVFEDGWPTNAIGNEQITWI